MLCLCFTCSLSPPPPSPLARESRKRLEIEAHPITGDYGLHMGGVDHMDRDLSNWGSSVRTARYYMRIFFWCFDSIVHCIFCIVAHYGNVEGHRWAKYTNKNDGRYKFQMDLAQTLIAAGIEMSWDGKDDSTKPKVNAACVGPPCFRPGGVKA